MRETDAPKDNPILPETTLPDALDNSTEMLLDERETARILRVSPSTVRNERQRGRIGFTKIGSRIFYTRTQIGDYLQRHTVDPCVSDPQKSGLDRLGITGSARSQDGPALPIPGAGLGSIRGLDKRLVSALAQQIFTRPASSSRTGSSQTRAPTERPPKKS